MEIGLLDDLNPEQHAAVVTRGACAIIAGPGSGKTKTMAVKAAHILQDHECLVGAVTFTKDAALELRDRVIRLAPLAKARLKAGTFHSLALQQIGKKASDIANEGERSQFVLRAMKQLGVTEDFDACMKSIERVKLLGTVPNRESKEGQLYNLYQDLLIRNKKIDFQDMILLAVKGMESGQISPYPFTHLLADEFQDTDPLQYRWIKCHIDAGAVTTIVGDDDQSIYQFRDAMGYGGMRKFIQETGAQTVVLGVNYRSHTEILKKASTLISKNQERIEKHLVSAKGKGGGIQSMLFKDAYDEGAAIADRFILSNRKDRTAAVLSRTNSHLDAIEAVLRTRNVAYHRLAGGSIFNQPEGAILCRLIEAVGKGQTDNWDGFLHFMGIAEEELPILSARLAHCSDFSMLKKMTSVNADISKDGLAAFNRLLSYLTQWRDLYKNELYSLCLSNIETWMLEHVSNKKRAIRIIKTCVAALSKMQGPLVTRIQNLQHKNNEASPEAVILTTMHGSKGLEWDWVWVIRAEESVCPSNESPEAEERRLMYVAMTRARECLTVSRTASNPTSRFVQEAELEDARP